MGIYWREVLLMARTVRAKRKSAATVRDGVFQYAAGGCRHHGSCGYCVQNRTFSRADVDWNNEVIAAMDYESHNAFWQDTWAK